MSHSAYRPRHSRRARRHRRHVQAVQSWQEFRSGCRDCRVDEDFYMVRDEVWAAAGLGPLDGLLCLGCLERRIGRSLRPDDLDDAPINHPDNFRSSQRLQHLKLRAALAKGLPLWKWQW